MEIEDDHSETKRKISLRRIMGATLIGIPILYIIFLLIKLYKVFGPLPLLMGTIGGLMIWIGLYLLIFDAKGN